MQCPTPVTVKDENQNRYIDVPCGKCGACKKNRRAVWSFRLAQEEKASSSCHFITLTYKNDELPFSGQIPTLLKDDLQKFIKRLREEIRKVSPKTTFRYYAVGEYGPESERPHYHIIAFNIPWVIRDRAFNKIREIWGLGNVTVDPITPARIHYVSKFHMNANKEEFIDSETGEVFERQSEFATMSRGNGIEGHKYQYGIGHNYIKRVKQWHLSTGKNYVINNGFKQKLPRYYKERIFGEEERKAVSILSEIKMYKSTKKEVDRLKKLGYKKPFREIWERALSEAKRVKDKNTGKRPL